MLVYVVDSFTVSNFVFKKAELWLYLLMMLTFCDSDVGPGQGCS